MISETHNMSFVSFFLHEFIRIVGDVPGSFNSDMSMVLLNSAARVFANFASITEYIDALFKMHFQKNPKIPACFIRIDRAHLIKNVVSCKALHNSSRLQKEFYVRSVCILMQSNSLKKVEYVLRSILIVAKSEYSGEYEDSPIYVHKNYLFDLIAAIPKDDLYQESDSVPLDESFYEQDVIEQINSGDMQNWLKEFNEKSNEEIYDGEKNTLYNPAFAPFLLNLCKTLVLWSALNTKFFKADENANSTANVESYFKDVKMSLKDEIPCRVDEFIAAHIDMINGMIIDASQDYVEFVDAAGGLKQFRETNLNGCDTDLNESSILDEFAENFTTHEENTDDINNFEENDSETSNQSQICSKNAGDAENLNSNENSSGDETNSRLGDLDSNSRSQNSCNNSRVLTSTPNAKKNVGKKISLSCNLNEKDKWSKSKRGKGKYLRSMPFLRLMTSEKKTPKIGFLRNASLSTVTHVINGRKIKLKNTCGFDSLVQVNKN